MPTLRLRLPPRRGDLVAGVVAFGLICGGIIREGIPVGSAARAATEPAEDADVAFFRERVLPILAANCLECHAHDGDTGGGLALDIRSGWEQGGVSGPAIVPGKPDESLLVKAVRHVDPDLQMPPDGRLSDDDLAVLVEWVRRGAADPRRGTAADGWEKVYADRLRWWSLQPVARPAVPPVRDALWPASDVDRFILAKLEAAGLRPAPPAAPLVLARRLAFALTGLPPTASQAARIAADPTPEAVDALVEELLASPHFGEHWARHWMDVVHYADTHGYEWDVPAKHAWRYRDYLVRSFNADLPYDRFVREQLAGDLVEPRVDPDSGVNEALVATMAFRMGERWHGDNAAAEATTAENLAGVVDTSTKALLATTVGCARCHDHKLDAIAQADYFAVVGAFMSSRWGVRCIDTADPNGPVLEELRELKRGIRKALADRWLAGRAALVERLRRVEPDWNAAAFPESLEALLRRPAEKPLAADAFAAERQRRIEANRANLRLLADFTVPDAAAAEGWRWEGFGMSHGLVTDGEPAIAPEGDSVLQHVLPAGRWSHVYSMRLAGALRSPELHRDPPLTLAVGFAAGRKASSTLNVDRAFHSERVSFAEVPLGGWLELTAGNFERIAGGPDTAERRVYLELATKDLENYFPPRTNYKNFKPGDERDPCSWFGVTRVYAHPPGHGPLDELERLAPIVTAAAGGRPVVDLVADRVLDAVSRWAGGDCGGADVAVLNEALAAGWLDNTALEDPALAGLLVAYRRAERRLQPDRTIGGLADWGEAADSRLEIRGDPANPGATVPRGTIRFLAEWADAPRGGASGRLEIAESIVHPRNPLTARVFVNRVWLHLFGDGLVRTPDDFGHLGEPPVHPELLDHLAERFMEEGWSLKKLVRMLVRTSTWRQSAAARPESLAADPENRLWHHHPRRRLGAEALRDAMLAVAGRLDPAMGGSPIDPARGHEDPAKRLFRGPLDGHGRRSLYLRMTLMEPPRFLALFNQPIPLVTVGKRDRTTVPDQALALLNDPFVIAMARAWAERTVAAGSGLREGGTESRGPEGSGPEGSGIESSVRALLEEALARPAGAEQVARLADFAAHCADLRGVPAADRLGSVEVWQDVAHAILAMQEFTHVD